MLEIVLWSIILGERRDYKVCTAKTMKLFKVGAELQPYVYHNSRTTKIDKLFEVSFLEFVSNIKVTL